MTAKNTYSAQILGVSLPGNLCLSHTVGLHVITVSILLGSANGKMKAFYINDYLLVFSVFQIPNAMEL